MISYMFDAKGYYLDEVEDFGFPPHNSTTVKPALIDGFIPRWNGVIWEQVENHKDEDGWLNGEPFRIREYGPYPAGFSKEKPGPTEEEIAQQKVESIKARLREIDSESNRPLRAIATGNAIDEDREKLAALDTEAISLRGELAEMGVSVEA